MLQVSFINQASAAGRIPRAVIYGALTKAARYYRPRLQAQRLSVVFVSGESSKKLNCRYRRKNKPTNVLSFASQVSGELGDIIICPSIAKREALTAGKSFSAQINYLFIHGLLHLLGFDHNNDKAAKLMKQAETKLMPK